MRSSSEINTRFFFDWQIWVHKLLNPLLILLKLGSDRVKKWMQRRKTLVYDKCTLLSIIEGNRGRIP